MRETERPVRFERVLDEELDLIAKSRQAFDADAGEIDRVPEDDSAYARARRASLLGLALSGGGIRSATFNLGVLQALAKHRLLSRFDYLSTVSGGGYIGAWFSAWIRRHAQGVLGVEAQMRNGLAGRGAEPPEIGWLRDYSNYLMVRLGFFSGDSWASVAIYLRNLTLNLTLVIACLGIAVLLPRFLLLGVGEIPANWFSTMGIVFFAISIVFIAVNLQSAESGLGWARGNRSVIAFIVLPGLVAAVLFANALLIDFPAAVYVRRAIAMMWPDIAPMHWLSWIISGAVLYTLPWMVAAAVARAVSTPTTGRRFLWRYVLGFAPPSGALLGFLAYCYFQAGLRILNEHPLVGNWLVTGFGTPAVVTIFCTVLVLHIGLISRGFSEDVREWWGRLGGWATLVTALWLLGFALVIYAPAFVAWLGAWTAAAGIGWIAATAAGVLLGKSAASSIVRPGQILERITTLLPFVFVAGLVIAVIAIMHAALAPSAEACAIANASWDESMPPLSPLAAHIETVYCELTFARRDTMLEWLVGLALIALIMSLRVDVNVFSLGPLYRNRLLRCYLGASRQGVRQPHPFTGFDRDDDLRLADLAGTATAEGPARPQRPYPIINTAINLTTGQKLAWQHRKAGAFAFTPLYCGYQMPEDGGERWVGRYCATADYVSGPANPRRRGSIALSNAITISGAAASPNAGYHSSPSVAFLLTVFNVRLGSWFQNPRRPDAWRRPGPLSSLKPLLSELFGLSNDRSAFVYLSDGGHFENLGIYELVRRRCRFIVACDASCDPKYEFEDLGNAIRKCRIDLDVDIEIDTSAMRPDGDHGLARHHCALGVVRYDRADPRESVGYLLYIKASVSGDEPQDVEQYRAEHREFPHQRTSDQFFDEPQFETYRQLGLHVMDAVLAEAVGHARYDIGWTRRDPTETGRTFYRGIDIERLFKELRQRWYPPLPVAGEVSARQAAALDHILDRLRTDEKLRFLDRQLNPEWSHMESAVGARSHEEPWLPDDVYTLRSAFYLCSSIIQLMDSVYVERGLEEHFDHPDNRGWMNLFRRFGNAGMLRVTWAVQNGMCGARFQSFCERHFGLGESTIELAAELTVGEVLSAQNAHMAHGSERRTLEILHAAAEIEESDWVVRLQLTVRDARSGRAEAGAFGFPVAFAVLRAYPGRGYGLRYFRVADHLQRVGLGWRATYALIDRYRNVELDLATRAPELKLVLADADRARYVRLFRAVRRIVLRQ